MPCWVAPVIAAELLNVPVEEVQRRVAEGSLAMRQEGGFTFVDVRPDAPANLRRRPQDRPPTFVPAPRPESRPPEEPLSDEEVEALAEVFAWRTARVQAASSRRAPGAAVAQAA